MKPKTVNLIQLNVAVLLWGLTAMFAKGINLPTSHIICGRSLVSAVALIIFLLATRTRVRMYQRSHYAAMGILGVLICAHWLMYFQALKISTAAVAILAMHTYPVLTAVVEPFVFGERLKKRDLLLALLVFAGVAIMTPSMDFSNNITQGIVLAIGSGVLFMIRNLMTRKYVQLYSGSTLMFWQVVVAGALLLPVVAMDKTAEYTPQSLGLLVLLGIAFTALPQALFAASFKNLSTKTAGILATLLPFYGAFWGYVIHHEQLSTRTITGGAIILACVIYETLATIKPTGNDETSTTTADKK